MFFLILCLTLTALLNQYLLQDEERTLRQPLSLIYSTPEYCASVWQRSGHINDIAMHVNNTMRIIAGTLKSTPVPWLYVTNNITPPEIRHQEATVNEWKKIASHTF
ncbi:hypothetical protein Trydic_g13939 [Trypoxylus dichotomus]